MNDFFVVPGFNVGIQVQDKIAVGAIIDSMNKHKNIFCVFSENSSSDPFGMNATSNLAKIGTVCSITRVFSMGSILKVSLKGLNKAKASIYEKNDDLLFAKVNILEAFKDYKNSISLQALTRTLKKAFNEYSNYFQNHFLLLKPILETSTNPLEIFHFVLMHLEISPFIKQKIYKQNKNLEKVIESLIKEVNQEIKYLKIEEQINTKVNTSISQTQRERFLRKQMEEIQRELDNSVGFDFAGNDIFKYEKLLKKISLNEEAKEKVKEEIKRMENYNPNSQDYSASINYLDWVFSLPWGKYSKVSFTLMTAKNVLDEDHYGLEKVKDYILEYLSVLAFTKEIQGKILCFVGPPGVGKTSLGKSIAKSLERKFVRFSLGGVKDESEIRGHRKTYVASMPGVIITSMKKAETMNPVIMMDEIDKMGMDHRGDPASALLEVLDPEQNNSFRDHYLDFSFDLSKVLFIATANSINEIPYPLLDRMNIVKISGYSILEKLNIAQKHLIRKMEEKFQIKNRIKVNFSENAILKIINSYTKEAGVRHLERSIETIFNKLIKKYLEEENSTLKTYDIDEKEVEDLLGTILYEASDANTKDIVGVVNGLAWTPYGGDILQIEVIKMPGNGKIKITGKLGEVMQESVQTAYSYVRKNSSKYNLEKDFYKKTDIHLHVPEGAVPKDGPSAGIAITTAITSALSGKKVNSKIAMTGEVTLTGRVLPIGGLPEKLMAAKSAKNGKSSYS